MILKCSKPKASFAAVASLVLARKTIKSIAFWESLLFYSMLLRNRRPPKWRVSLYDSREIIQIVGGQHVGSMLKGQTQRKTRTLLSSVVSAFWCPSFAVSAFFVSARLSEVLPCNFLLKPWVEVAMENAVKFLVKILLFLKGL